MSHPVTLDDETFKQQLVAVVPHLRAFAHGLGGGHASDDLAQEAAMRAWRARGSFQAGTNFKAWAFMILRNHFLTEKRRAWRSTALDPEVAENILIANDDNGAREELLDVRNALRA